MQGSVASQLAMRGRQAPDLHHKAHQRQETKTCNSSTSSTLRKSTLCSWRACKSTVDRATRMRRAETVSCAGSRFMWRLSLWAMLRRPLPGTLFPLRWVSSTLMHMQVSDRFRAHPDVRRRVLSILGTRIEWIVAGSPSECKCSKKKEKPDIHVPSKAAQYKGAEKNGLLPKWK